MPQYNSNTGEEMKTIGILLVIVGVLGLAMGLKMFGDIGIAAIIGGLGSLLSGLGFLLTFRRLTARD